MELCSYGCANPGIHILKNGKLCCRPFCGQCPELRRKNAEKQRARIDQRGFYKGGTAWNSGKTISDYTPEQARRTTENGKKNIKKLQETYWALEENRVKHSETMRKIAVEKGYGGYIRGSGRGKKGWYRGIWCDSRWELAYVMYCLDHQITIVRNTQRFPYEFEGETYQYLPDFLVEGQLVEIKGWMTDQNRAKLAQCPKPVEVIDKVKIQSYINYAIGKYGKNYISLYEIMED